MLRALNTAATGMAAQETNVNNIANNVANVNTTGYKRARTEFEDLLYESVQEPGGRSSASTLYNAGLQIGSGVKATSARKIHTQGDTLITKNPFDLMVSGEGFFGVIMPNNDLRFTRDGSFNVDSTGTIVTKNGHKLFPGITIPPNTSTVNISTDGSVDAFLVGQVQPQNVGSIPVFTFTNPVGLKSIGGNLLAPSASSGASIQNIAGSSYAGPIQQGMLESSNVNVMTEMTDLIKAQRSFELNSKVMNMADQMLQNINNIR